MGEHFPTLLVMFVVLIPDPLQKRAPITENREPALRVLKLVPENPVQPLIISVKRRWKNVAFHLPPLRAMRVIVRQRIAILLKKKQIIQHAREALAQLGSFTVSLFLRVGEIPGHLRQ